MIFILYFAIVLRLNIVSSYLLLWPPSTSTLHKTQPSKNIEKPLLLTPLLEAGNVSEALERSRVPELLPKIYGNAAYFTVNKTYNSNLFFWFIRKTGSNWKTAPLLLWLQGGPGCASMFGLFGETGPYMIVNGRLTRRKYAWTNNYNMLYIDQPAGTGYSFTDSKDGYIGTQQEVAEHLYLAMTQFFQLYPELRKNEFYITGESYAGKYIPSIAHKIHLQNKVSKMKIKLMGLFIISGYSDPISILHYSDYLYPIGLIDNWQKQSIANLESRARAFIRSGLWKNATSEKRNIIINLWRAKIGFYDYTRENFSGDEQYIDYIQTDEMRKSIHVGDVQYEDCSEDVHRAFDVDRMQSVKPIVEELLEHYPIAYVGGQLDVIVAYPLVVTYLQKLRWRDADVYSKSERKIWQIGKKVAGYYKIAGNLKDVMVRNAGHMIPAEQPKHTLFLLDKFVNNKF